LGKAAKTVAHRSACYFFMLAPKEAAVKTIAYRSACYFFMPCAKRSGNQKQYLMVLLVTFLCLRQMKRQSEL
jgi:hypothetical protein